MVGNHLPVHVLEVFLFIHEGGIIWSRTMPAVISKRGFGYAVNKQAVRNYGDEFRCFQVLYRFEIGNF